MRENAAFLTFFYCFTDAKQANTSPVRRLSTLYGVFCVVLEPEYLVSFNGSCPPPRAPCWPAGFFFSAGGRLPVWHGVGGITTTNSPMSIIITVSMAQEGATELIFRGRREQKAAFPPLLPRGSAGLRDTDQDDRC